MFYFNVTFLAVLGVFLSNSAGAQEVAEGASGKAFEWSATYKGELVSNRSGGISQGTDFLGNLDLKLTLDTGKISGWQGGKFFLYGLYDHGGKPSQRVGDAQVTSNIETPVTTFKLHEAYLEQTLPGDRMSLLLGLHDLNASFYSNESAGIFMNSSFGIGADLAQTGDNGPSIFPTTSMAVRLSGQVTDKLSLQAAVFDAIPGSLNDPRGTHVSLASDEGAS